MFDKEIRKKHSIACSLVACEIKNQHIQTTFFSFYYCFLPLQVVCNLIFFDLWPKSKGQTKRSTWTLMKMYVCLRPTHWHSFNRLKLFEILFFLNIFDLLSICSGQHDALLLSPFELLWSGLSFTFDPLTKGQTQRLPWTLLNVVHGQHTDTMTFAI